MTLFGCGEYGLYTTKYRRNTDVREMIKREPKCVDRYIRKPELNEEVGILVSNINGDDPIEHKLEFLRPA